ncbi:heparinase II/III-family protein [Pelagibacteraceae bacterium]|nr:heparinase II/III-family protein [Pelagibacteraceae bacterium]|tara:strand:+ start:105 stop:1760 length:1656 start_codon:yes stop_codon:yes gene_type:complete
MSSLRASYFYLLAVRIALVNFFKKIYFTTNYYNKSLKTKIPEHLYFYPNPYLLSSFVNQKNFAFKLSRINIDTFWINHKSYEEEENLNSFFWLNLINRKNDGSVIQKIISIWINSNTRYNKKNWQNSNISKRILAWILNADIILNNADVHFRKIFFLSIIAQVNHLKNNLNYENSSIKKIEIISAIILSGLVFKEYNKNFELGIKELKKIVEDFFNNDGCPISRNMYDLVQSSKFLILIKECCNDAQEYIPDYLEDIVEKQIDCLYSMEAPINRNPLFNGSSEFKINSYLSYLTGLDYKIKRERENINQIYILKGKKFFLFFDAGSPPRKKNSGSYQSGPLSFEYFIDNHKIITNCGFGKKISKKAELISKLTSAQSTLCLNDSSVIRFERSNLINKIFGSSITSSFKIFDLHLNEDINFTSISATHDAYKNNFGYLHERQIKINKKNGSLSGVDNLTSDKNRHGLTNTYGIRFHLYPGIVAVQTIGKNSILIHIEKNKSLVFTAIGENISLEKSIFLGRNQIINNSCITISGVLKYNESKKIYWELKKYN